MLFFVDVELGDIEELVYNFEGGYFLGEFFKDGMWFVYLRLDEDLNLEVYFFDFENCCEYNVM